jgi:hypothetical protein
MTWKEVRKQYPNQFVKFEITESHVVGNKEYVDDIAIPKLLMGKGNERICPAVRRPVVYCHKYQAVIIDLVQCLDTKAIWT